MEKVLKDFYKELSNEQIGEIVRLTLDYENDKTIGTSDSQVVRYFFKTFFVKYVDNKKEVSRKRSVANAKRKNIKEVNANE